MSDAAIRVEQLGKRYRIGETSGTKYGYKYLRETLANAFTRSFRRLTKPYTLSHAEKTNDTIWALKDVSFEVKRGEVVGVIGRNGAGKSTLLKILSRITEPTRGRVAIHGRVGSLLEVGTGFHQELTGRDNIYLNAAILGMKKREIERKFDEIVSFAEIEKFIDTPVKHYSSGMYVRLAFSVAAHLDPEILLVDEDLAVGDASFQKKCLGEMDSAAREGTTVLLISHNMGAITKLCSRAIWMEGGRIVFAGDTGEAVEKYLGAQPQGSQEINLLPRRAESDAVRIVDAWLEKRGARTSEFFFGEEIDVVIRINVLNPVHFDMELLCRDGQGLPIGFAGSGWDKNLRLFGEKGEMVVRCKLKSLRLAEGRYSLDLILAETGVKYLDYVESALVFHIHQKTAWNRNLTFKQSLGRGAFFMEVEYERK